MRIWDSIKKAFHDAVDDVKHFDVETGSVDEVPEGYEIRHQPAYDHVTGVESMQPMLVKSSDVSETQGGPTPAAMK